ncbi:MAG: hypothetical protein CMN09_03675 [Roseobacter sp.]|nr:hypothetical protein [Roseobacter sp.]OUT38207.1 MAG: hypothetical protein CBB63_03035 [Sulfitobacter sp. TMED3]
MHTNTDWKSALTDVRRAYRIVVAYHKQTHHLMREVENLFPELEFAYWDPVYTLRPATSLSRPMDKWTWDGVPFHNMLACFLPRGIRRDMPLSDGDWFVVAHLDSDTGVFDENNEQVGEDKAPDPSRLMPAEKSASILYLYAFIIDHISAGSNARDLWRNETTDAEDGVWATCHETGVKMLYRKRALEDVFPEGKIQHFVSQIRSDLRLANVELAVDDQR